MRRSGLLIPAVGLLAAFFGWKCYAVWTEPFPPPLRSTGEAAGFFPSASPAAPARSADLSAAVSLVTVRPVFRPDRTLFAKSDSVAARNYDAELNRYTVLGILGGEEGRKAIVAGGASGKSERYEVGPGEGFPGFTVKEVRENEVLVLADNVEFALPLYAGGPKGTVEAARTDTTPAKTARQATPAAGSPATQGAEAMPAAAAPAPRTPAASGAVFLPSPGATRMQFLKGGRAREILVPGTQGK